MRAPTAIFLLSAVGSLACANRGMHAPTDGGPGSAGAAGTAGRGGQGGTSSRGGTGGTAQGGTGGGPTGTGATGGTGGSAGTSGNCNVAADAGASGGACGATFNFETDTQGATLNAGSPAFQTLTKSSAFTFCGSGALAITSMFTGTSGSPTKGDVVLNLPGAPVDLTGKTITVHVASDPGCSPDLNLSLVLNTQSGAIYFTPTFPIRPVTNVWKTASATVPAVSGSTTALQISLQAISSTGYQGTIYLDEIDIK